MADQLLKYVEDQLAKGFKPDMIKARLVRQGYSPALVEGIIESVSIQRSTPIPMPVGVNHEKSVFTKLIILLLVLGVLIAGVFLIPGLFKEKSPLLDVQAIADKLTYAPGEEAGFDLEITNMGSADRFDVTLLYRVLDKNDISVISKEETVAISTSTSYHRAVTLPASIKPGNYLLKVFANYGGKVATTSFSFEVSEGTGVIVTTQPSCTDGIKNQNELGIDCGGKCGGYWYDGSCHSGQKTTPVTPSQPSCGDRIKNQDETEIDCGGVCGGYWYDNDCHATQKITPLTTEPSFAETMIKVTTIAKTNPEEAKNTCLGLAKPEEKDRCLKKIADVAAIKDYCDLIVGVSDRDECYYPFFMKGDYTVCEKLTDPQSRKSCEDLRDIDQIRSQLQIEST